jgi:CubicO group peptidase (beta-lactamase class C family)
MAAGITLDGLQRFASSLARDDEPGLAIGTYSDGTLTAHAAAGCAVPEHGVPVSEQTMFDIASVSKHMTATCLLLLARDGVLDLDADIRPALPELAVGVPLTLRQCLSHTSGLRDYFALCEIAGIGVPGMTEDRFADLITGQRDLNFPPGSAFSYSNTGYALTSLLVRRATGHGLAQFAADRVFGPLGMTATHFRDDVARLVPRLAAGYVATGGTEPGFRRYDTTEEVIGDGAVVTSLADLAAWHGFMASGRTLGADIRDQLLDARPLTGGEPTGYGLGLQAITVEGRPAWWHSGSWAGYRAAVLYFPEHHIGVTTLANRDDRYASHVAVVVAAALLSGGDPARRYRELGGAPAGGEIARAAANAVAGVWHEPEQDSFMDVAADGEQLLVGGDNGQDERFTLGADGRWRGSGAAGASFYLSDDDELVPAWGLADRPGGRFRRAESVTGGGDQPRGVPAGLYWNSELRVRADLAAGPVPHLAIGLAPARPLVPAGPDVWRCRGGDQPGATRLTVLAAGDGAELLVSVPGARRVRFTRLAPGAADPGLPRGLRGWAR